MDEDFTPRRAPGLRAIDEPEVGLDEDFLFHLSRGSDYLMENQVALAKEELERALRYRPEDARSQDLLAGVYFRLGVYPRAIEIWSRLVRMHPEDVTLRVNLGLALLKTGQPEDASAHLERAIEIEAEHPRAWGYLGLVRWRQGRIDEARDAFTRGGQASMARRMEELVAESAEELGTGEAPVAPAPPPDVSAMRQSAGAALDEIEQRDDVLVVERSARERKPSGAWRVHEAGKTEVPRTAYPAHPMSADAPMTIGALLDWWAPAIPGDQPLVVTPAGALIVATRTALHARATGVRAVRGSASRAPVARRYRRAIEETMGDEEPVLRWEGETLAVFAPRTGDRFQALRIEDDVLYVVERFVQAFDDQVTFESGRLPAHAGAARLVQFRGSGSIVLRVPRAPSAIPVGTGLDARVAPDALLGWTGRLFPIEEPAGADDPATLVLRGEGTLLLV